MRIRRHDEVVNFIFKRLRKKRLRVDKEPKIQTNLGLRKPDLVVVRDNTAFVIDAQIVNNANNTLNIYNENKIAYYRDCAPFVEKVKEIYNVRHVEVGAVTISYKGLWSPSSFKWIIENQFVPRHEIKFLTNKVLLGGLLSFRMFYKSTAQN